MASSEKSQRQWVVIVCLVLILLILGWIAQQIWFAPKPIVQEMPTPAMPAPAMPAPVKVHVETIKTQPPKKILPAKTTPASQTVPHAASPVVTPSVKSVTTPQLPVQNAYVPPSLEAEPQEWQGNDTSVTHVGQIVIHNDHQWVHFWSEHHPHEAAPDVDFSKNMVLGVFAGPRPAEQFTIRIVDVRAQPATLVVDYVERLPPPGTFAVNVTVYPYYLKVFPLSALPVKFNELPPENVQR